MEQSLKDAQKTSESCDNCSDLKIETKSVGDFVDGKPLQSHPVEEVPKVEESSCDIRQDIVVGFDRRSEVLNDTTLGCDTKTSEDDIGEVSASDEQRGQSIRLDDFDCRSKKESIIAPPSIEPRSDAELPIVSTEEVKLKFDDVRVNDAEKMGRKEDSKEPTADSRGSTLDAEAAIFHSSKDHKEPGDIVTIGENKGEMFPEIQLESQRMFDLHEPPICSVGLDGFVPGKLDDTFPEKFGDTIPGKLDDTVPKDLMDDKVSGFEKKIELKEMAVTEEDVTEKTSEIFAHDIEVRESPESVIGGEVNERPKYLHESEYLRDLNVQSDQYIDPKNILENKSAHADAIETAISKDDVSKTIEKGLESKEIGSNDVQDVFAAKEVSVSDVPISNDSSTRKSDMSSSNFTDECLLAGEVLPDDKNGVKSDEQISKEANNLTGVVNEGKPQEKDNSIISKSITHFDTAKETSSPNEGAADVEVFKKILDDTIQYDADISESEASAAKSTALSLNGIPGKEGHDEIPTAMKNSESSAVKGSGENLDDQKENPIHDSEIDGRRDVKVSDTKPKEKEVTVAAASNIISKVCKDDKGHATETLDEKRIELDVGKEEKATTEGGDKEYLPSFDIKIGLQSNENLPIKESVQNIKELPPKDLPHEETVAKLTEAPQSIPVEKSSPSPVKVSTHVELFQSASDDNNKSDTDTLKPAKEAEKMEVSNGETHQDIAKEMPPKDLVQSAKVSENQKSDIKKPEKEVKKGLETEIVKDNEMCKDVAQEFSVNNAAPCLDTTEDLKFNTPEPLRDLELHVENGGQLIDSDKAISKEVSVKLEQITKTSEDLKDGFSEPKSEIIILDAGQSMTPLHASSTKQPEICTDDDGTLKSNTNDQKEIMKTPSDVNGGVSDTIKDNESDILAGGQSNALQENIKHEDAHTDVSHEICVKDTDARMIDISLNLNESQPQVCKEVEHKEHVEPTEPVDNREMKQEVPLPCPDHQTKVLSPENPVLDIGDTKGEGESSHIPTGSKEVICDILYGNAKDNIQTSEDQFSHEDDQVSQLQADKDVIEEVPKGLHEDEKTMETFDSDNCADKPAKLEESIQDEASKDIIQDAPFESGAQVVTEDSVDKEPSLIKVDDKPKQLEETIQVGIISEDQVIKSIKLDLIASGEEDTKKDEHKDAGEEGKEGDHDSGVDESTQGKLETADESHDTPTKDPSERRDGGSPLAADKGKSSIPSTPRSKDVRETSDSSAAAKSPLKTSSKSPSATMPAKTPPVADKKVPMNKVVVGTAPSPNLKVVKSKIGSMQNVKHRPGGGQVKVETKKIDLTSVKPKVGSTDHATHKPGGGDKKVVTTKLEWKAQSKIGSLDNAQHKPGGGEKKIESVKLNFKDKAKPRVGSTDNIKHKPGGGQVQIEEHKLEIKAKAKIGSLENAQHKPGGGNVQIFDEKTYYHRQESSSKANSEGHISGEQSPDAELSSLQHGGQEANGESAQ